MNVEIELKPPMMPNFIRTKLCSEATIAVADLTPGEAEEYAELMRKTFLAHWEKKRSKR